MASGQRLFPFRSPSSEFRTRMNRLRTLGAAIAVSCAASIISFVWFSNRGMTNLYPDGVAHLNIARKVVDHPDDSIWQRYIQIGTPWLPLQTALMLPLVSNEELWRNGAAGSIVSMVSFVIAGAAVFLIAGNLYGAVASKQKWVLPWLAAGSFILNPSLLYMQTTPMSEVPFMAATASSVYLIQRWSLNQKRSALIAAGLASAIAALARYEAWPIAALAALWVLLAAQGTGVQRFKSVLLFISLTALGPLYWMWHNWAIFDDPLAFFTGPHSARGIYIQNQSTLGPARALVGSLPVATVVMLLAVAVCAGLALLAVAAFGLIKVFPIARESPRRWGPAVLLGVPFCFHVISLYRGEIQIFPVSAFGLLNVRYGVPHLLPLSLLVPAAALLLGAGRKWWPSLAVFAIIAGGYIFLISDGVSQIAIYQEAYRNGVNSKAPRELARVAGNLRDRPPSGVLLMYTGALGPVVSQSNLRFRNIIHEGTTRWHSIDQTIPPDVSTIVFQQDDPLASRIRSASALSHDFEQSFELTFSLGKTKRFDRKRLTGG